MNIILKPLEDWYLSGAEDYEDFIALVKSCYTSAYILGQEDMKNRAIKRLFLNSENFHPYGELYEKDVRNKCAVEINHLEIKEN